jgi:hypothetical protein
MMVNSVRPAYGAISTSNTQQSNDSAEVPQLGLANRLIVHFFDFFHDNILHYTANELLARHKCLLVKL